MEVATLGPLDFCYRDRRSPQVTSDPSPVAAGSLYTGTPRSAEALSPTYQPLVALRGGGHTQLAPKRLPRWSRATATTWVSRCVSTPKVTSALASGLSAPIIVTFAQFLSMCRAHFPPDEQERTDDTVTSRVSGECLQPEVLRVCVHEPYFRAGPLLRQAAVRSPSSPGPLPLSVPG
jgi:hypothetical protein